MTSEINLDEAIAFLVERMPSRPQARTRDYGYDLHIYNAASDMLPNTG